MTLLDPQTLQRLLIAATIFAGLSSFLLAVFKFALSRARKHTSDPLIETVKGPFRLGLVVFSASTALQVAPADVRTHPAAVYGLKLAFVMVGLGIVDRLLTVFVKRQRFIGADNLGTRTLLQKVLRLSLFVVGILVVLDTVGISITPLLASLGVSSIAVALALQDTLSNFFSGIYLLVDKPLRVGDYVRLPDNIEGRVRHIGWRSTEIEHPSLYAITIPNSKLSTATLINLDMPTHEMSLSVSFPISFNNDLDLVEKLALSAAQQVAENSAGVVKGTQPSFLFSGVRAGGIDASIGLRVLAFENSGRVRHELIQAVLPRFKEAGIVFKSEP